MSTWLPKKSLVIKKLPIIHGSMFWWFFSRLASKVRLTENNFQLVSSRLCWRRNYAGNDIIFSPCTKYKTVLVEAICNEGNKALAAGVNAKDLREGIQMATRVVLENLSSRARLISTSEEIAQVATTSSNGDKDIGLLVAKAIEEVGNKKGRIFISVAKNSSINLSFFYGIKLHEGYLSSFFTTNKGKKISVLNYPQIFICEAKFSNYDVVVELLRLAAKEPLLIIAEDFDDCVLDALIAKKLTTGIKVCAVKSHSLFGESWKDRMQLLASATMSSVFTEEDFTDFRYPSADVTRPKFSSMLGRSSKVIVAEDDTVLLAFQLSMEDIEKIIAEEIEELKSIEARDHFQLQLRSTSNVTKEDWLFAVLQVGGASGADAYKKKNIVTEALKAAKAAIEGGVVPGGGIALLNASKELKNLQTTTSGQKIGVQIIQDALKTPVLAIASSARVEGSVVVDNLLMQANPNLGYDATKGEYIDMIKHGILDPLKVVRSAFVGATRVFLKKLNKYGERPPLHVILRRRARKYCIDKKWDEVGVIQGKAI